MQGSDFQVPPPPLSLSLFPSYVMHELFEDSLQYQVFCLRVLIQTVPAKTYTRARARARICVLARAYTHNKLPYSLFRDVFMRRSALQRRYRFAKEIRPHYRKWKINDENTENKISYRRVWLIVSRHYRGNNRKKLPHDRCGIEQRSERQKRRKEEEGKREEREKKEKLSAAHPVSQITGFLSSCTMRYLRRTCAGNILSGLTFICIYQVAKKQRVKTRDDLSFVDSCVNGPVESDCLE